MGLPTLRPFLLPLLLLPCGCSAPHGADAGSPAPPPPRATVGRAGVAAPAPDLSSSGGADLGAAAAPALADAEPASGPAGTPLLLTGSGFQAGDSVEISGPNVAPTALTVVSLTAAA